MRIFMTTDTVGGQWRSTRTLIATLDRYGIHIRLFCLGPLSSRQREGAAGFRHLELTCADLPRDWCTDSAALEDLAPILREAAADYGADVIHINHLLHGDLDWTAPALVVIHDWFDAVDRQCPVEPVNAARVRASLRGAGAVIASSHWLLAEARRRHGPFQRQHVIHAGTDLIREVVADRDPVVLCSGRLWDEGDVTACLATAASTLPWPVLLPGARDGEGDGARNIEHLGWLAEEELWDHMSRAAIYAAPARHDAFALGVLEAARLGCPLVLGDLPPLRELWAGAALFVDPDDPAAWRNALIRLVDDPELRRALATAAQSRSWYYGADRMAQRYLTCYAEISGTGPAVSAW